MLHRSKVYPQTVVFFMLIYYFFSPSVDISFPGQAREDEVAAIFSQTLNCCFFFFYWSSAETFAGQRWISAVWEWLLLKYLYQDASCCNRMKSVAHRRYGRSTWSYAGDSLRFCSSALVHAQISFYQPEKPASILKLELSWDIQIFEDVAFHGCQCQIIVCYNKRNVTVRVFIVISHKQVIN